MSVETFPPLATGEQTAEATAPATQDATAGAVPPEQPPTTGAAPEPEQPPYWAQLTEGRIVHYVLPSGAHRPAMVVALGDAPGTCNLRVFTDGEDAEFSGSLLFRIVVEPDATGQEPGTWHWIERAG